LRAGDAALFSHREIYVGQLRLHVVVAGQGPLVVLLHGFPEHWYSWRHQLRHLARAGYRAVAVDLPGYGLSDRPRELAAYRPSTLAETIARLIGKLGADSAVLVGHNWGGGVAWYTAAYQPEVVSRLVVMGAPHPVRMARWVRTPRGAWAESHGLLAQLPRLGPMIMSRRKMQYLRGRFLDPAVARGALEPADVKRYAESLTRGDGLRGALSYYQSAVRFRRESLLEDRVIECPALMLWGSEDRFVPGSLARPPRKLVPDAQVSIIRGADHWLAGERPAEVGQALDNFLAATEHGHRAEPSGRDHAS
jgi:pimeloyl-ACP methyl ester carboxylesterase